MSKISVLDDTLHLSTSEVAEMLDSHPSSIKRWATDNDLACITTSGGHRRFTLEAVKQFSEKAGIPFLFAPLEEDLNVYLTALRTHPAELDRSMVALLYRWLMSSKTARAEWALTHLHKTRYSLGGLFDRIMCPLLTRVGLEWEQGRVTVAQEHLVSHQLMEAMYRLRPQLGELRGERPIAICAGAENVLHVLPLMCARLILEHQGWNVVYLGASVPNMDLVEMILDKKPRLVCLSFALPLDDSHVRRSLSALAAAHKQQPFILAIGGKPAEGVEMPASFRTAGTFLSLTQYETWVLEQTVLINLRKEKS